MSALSNYTLTPVAVLGGLQFRELNGSTNTMCGVTLDDVTYCWGGGQYGNTGHGIRENRGAPTAVVGLP